MHLEPSKSCFFSLNRLNFLTYLVNVGNAVVAFAIVLVWCVTKSGEKAGWMKVILSLHCTLYTECIKSLNIVGPRYGLILSLIRKCILFRF